MSINGLNKTYETETKMVQFSLFMLIDKDKFKDYIINNNLLDTLNISKDEINNYLKDDKLLSLLQFIIIMEIFNIKFVIDDDFEIEIKRRIK